MTDFSKISYRFHKDIRMLEFSITENGIVNDSAFIEKMVVLVDLVGHLKPKSLLFDKKDANFEISKAIRNFTKQSILGDIKRFGVEKLYIVLNSIDYNRYLELPQKPDFIIKVFPSTSVEMAVEHETMSMAIQQK